MPYKDPQKQKEYMRNYAQGNRGKIKDINKRYYQNKKLDANEGILKDPTVMRGANISMRVRRVFA